MTRKQPPAPVLIFKTPNLQAQCRLFPARVQCTTNIMVNFTLGIMKLHRQRTHHHHTHTKGIIMNANPLIIASQQHRAIAKKQPATLQSSHPQMHPSAAHRHDLLRETCSHSRGHNRAATTAGRSREASGRRDFGPASRATLTRQRHRGTT